MYHTANQYYFFLLSVGNVNILCVFVCVTLFLFYAFFFKLNLEQTFKMI